MDLYHEFCDKRGEGKMDIKLVLSIVGGTLGAITFFWKLLEELLSHVTIDIKVDSLSWVSKDKATALVTITNSGKIPKRINYAVLLLTNEEEKIDQTISKIFGKHIESKSEAIYYINQNKVEKIIYSDCGTAALIPLPYFHSEQFQIGNEKIAYRCSIDLTKLIKDKNYDVRAYVFMSHIGFIRWRTSSDLLII